MCVLIQCEESSSCCCTKSYCVRQKGWTWSVFHKTASSWGHWPWSWKSSIGILLCQRYLPLPTSTGGSLCAFNTSCKYSMSLSLENFPHWSTVHGWIHDTSHHAHHFGWLACWCSRTFQDASRDFVPEHICDGFFFAGLWCIVALLNLGCWFL